MAANFTLKPTWVYPVLPQFNTIISQSESMKKEYFSMASTSVKRYKLTYNGLSDADFETLLDHYNSCYGGYDSFNWMNSAIPSYILLLLDLTTENITGRWVHGSLTFKPEAKSWDASIIFEEEN
jgi:hypothetical protein